MKVQLLYLDPHDDHVSVRDKMGWVKAPRLLIVWPRHGRVLTRRLDLRLVQRQAARRGSQLGLVSFDPDVRDHAAELGIPVFDSADALPESLWQTAVPVLETRPPDRSRLELPARPAVPPGAPGTWASRFRWLVFGLALAALGALAAALIPSATIVLSPATRVEQVSFPLRLDPSIDAPTRDGRLPAVPRSLTVNGHLRLPTTGAILVPTTNASGEVTFTNLGQLAVTIPSGTGLLASAAGARFVTTQTVQLAAGQGAQISAAIQAAAPGPEGNVDPAAIDAIEGPLGLQVSVTNPQATSGGAERSKPAVSAADLDKLESQLRAQLMAQAANEFTSDLEDGQAWDPASLTAVRSLQSDYDADLGEVAETVSLTMRLETSGWVYSQADLEHAASVRLGDRLQPGAAAVPGSLLVTAIPSEDKPGLLQVSARQSIFNPPSAAAVAQLAAGQPPAVAEAAIETQVHPLDLELVLRPDWLPRLPWLPVRIQLRYPWEGA